MTQVETIFNSGTEKALQNKIHTNKTFLNAMGTVKNRDILGSCISLHDLVWPIKSEMLGSTSQNAG